MIFKLQTKTSELHYNFLQVMIKEFNLTLIV